MPIKLAIVGRPNVGKSTLFNRLLGKRRAIVSPTPGVTRDRAYETSDFGGLPLILIDTAGFEQGAKESLTARMLEQTEKAIAEADVCLFMVDAREGVTPGDEIVAGRLRKSGKPVIVAANKCEGSKAVSGHGEAYGLGFGEPIALSAEHGTGLSELLDALLPFAPKDDIAEAQAERASNEALPEAASEETEAAARPLRLAIVGRPNVGKSSLLNRILGEERVLTSAEAGTTRDAVAAVTHFEGREILIHDTAGMRKRGRIEDESLEKLSVESTLTAIRFADCVILVLDADIPFEKQDLAIADLIEREGRAAVFAVNKWDKVNDRKSRLAALKEKLERLLPQVSGAPLVMLSANTGEGMERLMPAVLGADAVWNKRIPTAGLNRFLKTALERHPPPAVSGRMIRIRYMTQAKARPPSFVLFGNQLKALPENYLRYLTHRIREDFGLPGTPIRFALRETKNPYAGRGGKS